MQTSMGHANRVKLHVAASKSSRRGAAAAAHHRSAARSCRVPAGFLLGLVTSLLGLATFLAFQQAPVLLRSADVVLSLPSWARKNKLNATAGDHHHLNDKKSSRKEEKNSSITLLPLKDLSRAREPMEGDTWFMSSLHDSYEPGEAEYMHFSSSAPGGGGSGGVLCLAGNNTRDGTANAYAIVAPGAVPPEARVLPGLTFVSDTYYSYDNICHGLFAVMPFAAWHQRQRCARPARWVLYHKGELRAATAPWVRELVELTFGKEMRIERLEAGDGGRALHCFEEAVVFRHNEGMMRRERKLQVYEMMRCKSRAHCGIDGGGGGASVRFTLLPRKATGARSFEDDEAVAEIFRRECGKVEGCRFRVARADNLTFCEQVRLMSETDILASPHGAQLTNLIFMDKNSTVMEFFPFGWKELAGPGQHVFEWIAANSGVRHAGAWHDPEPVPCPLPERAECMRHYKNRQLGHDAAYFASWAAKVLLQEKRRKAQGPLGAGGANRTDPIAHSSCQCSQ